MPENKNEKTVDIDTSGPGAEVELNVKPTEQEKEYETTADDNKSTDTVAQSNEQPVVQPSKQETENKDQGTQEVKPQDTEAKKELEDYSEGVQKRIAKLTKKMREAERQREAALEYARKVQAEKESLSEIGRAHV